MIHELWITSGQGDRRRRILGARQGLATPSTTTPSGTNRYLEDVPEDEGHRNHAGRPLERVADIATVRILADVALCPG